MSAPDRPSRVVFDAGLDLIGPESSSSRFMEFFESLKSGLVGASQLEVELVRRIVVARFTELEIPHADRMVAKGLHTANGHGPTAAKETQGQAVAFPDPEPWPEPVDGAELLADLREFVSRFLNLPSGAEQLLATFVVATYAADAFHSAPYLVLHSPAPQCGKTRALEVLGLLVRRPWLTITPSTAVLFRVLEQFTPTLLLDEAEVVRGPGDTAKDVQALLQSGYRRGATVPRCVGDSNEVRNFRVFGPKVFALIGQLPPALFDRCIPVEMQRRPRGDRLVRFRPSRLESEAMALRRRAQRWASDCAAELGEREPPIFEALDERQQEVWDPLFAVGMIVGGAWYEHLVAAAQALSGGREATSVGIELLTDIEAVFATRGTDRLSSTDLAQALVDMEGRPWAEWSRGKGLTANTLARLLHPFGVNPIQLRIGGQNVRGYTTAILQTALSLYVQPLQRYEPSSDATNSPFANRDESDDVAVAKSQEIPHDAALHSGAAVEKGVDPGLWVDVPTPAEPEGEEDEPDEPSPFEDPADDYERDERAGIEGDA